MKIADSLKVCESDFVNMPDAENVTVAGDSKTPGGRNSPRLTLKRDPTMSVLPEIAQ
jgi:hypothetical protein